MPKVCPFVAPACANEPSKLASTDPSADRLLDLPDVLAGQEGRLRHRRIPFATLSASLSARSTLPPHRFI